MRYIIADEDYGVFLGTRKDIDGNGIGMLFSAHNFLELTSAVSWKTHQEAFRYMSRYISEHVPSAQIIGIKTETKTDYVSALDICKSGYGAIAADMIDALPMSNTTIH